MTAYVCVVLHCDYRDCTATYEHRGTGGISAAREQAINGSERWVRRGVWDLCSEHRVANPILR